MLDTASIPTLRLNSFPAAVAVHSSAESEKPMKIIAAKLTGKPEHRSELLALATFMLEPSRGESGCLSYNFHEQIPGSNQFFFFEEWESQAAIDAHFQTPHFAKFASAIPSLIEGAPEIRIYDVSAVVKL